MQRGVTLKLLSQAMGTFFKTALVPLLVIGVIAYGLFMFGIAYTLKLGPILVLQVIADEQREMTLGLGTWVICIGVGLVVAIVRTAYLARAQGQID